VDPKLRRRLDGFYRIAITAGVTAEAICLGLLLGGNHVPALVGFLIANAMFTAGQVWARRRL
jgi:hypothetical protein